MNGHSVAYASDLKSNVHMVDMHLRVTLNAILKDIV
jgi:hypothetical protein